MNSHLLDPDRLLRTDEHAGFAFGAIARSSNPYTFGVEIKYDLGADFEALTMVLAFG
jgi:hypothetical protein